MMSYILIQNNPRLAVSTAFRALGTTARACANHYDVLGITPKANQNEIKSAYYKLSKLYHPDISKDEETDKKFRAITEAYKVLGNIGLKRLYDKGLLVGKENTTRMDYKPDPEPTDPTLKFYKSRVSRHVPTIDGRTPIYDFDTWSKEHYGNILKKNEQAKRAVKTKEENRKIKHDSIRQEATMFVICTITFLFLTLTVFGKPEYDRNKISHRHSGSKDS
ncbi:dnaJ homolog subfamily C member 30, mitochondrial [Leptidea sinapis]|uniref:J domain-containing protein n=1 Tax=Leptidea sinapis TaxID=189913 RepID=A0A5E4QQ39_9NEOP|nr:dnaJ homolog subfamily C member 30, mitochondrial [Leptidea sinapis]VVC99743.1 unnamed protein product [Leptidea sinapis]